MSNEQKKEALERMLAELNDYPLHIINNDGTRILDYIPAKDSLVALESFDKIFMSLHATRKMYGFNVVDLPYFSKEYPDAIRIELHDSDNHGTIIASYEINYESEV